MTEHPLPDFDGTGIVPLHLRARRVHDDVLVVVVCGELDCATAPQVTRYLQQVSSPATGVLAVDLAGVGFLASSGVQMLVTALGDDHGIDGVLHLIAPSPPVRKVLTLLGLDRVFTSHATLDDLLRAVLPSRAGGD